VFVGVFAPARGLAAAQTHGMKRCVACQGLYLEGKKKNLCMSLFIISIKKTSLNMKNE